VTGFCPLLPLIVVLPLPLAFAIVISS